MGWVTGISTNTGFKPGKNCFPHGFSLLVQEMMNKIDAKMCNMLEIYWKQKITMANAKRGG
jgi:hypothetical protein